MRRCANDVARLHLGPDTPADAGARQHADRTAFLVCAIWSGGDDREEIAIRLLAQLHEMTTFPDPMRPVSDTELGAVIRQVQQDPRVRALIHACCRFDQQTNRQRLTPVEWNEAVETLIGQLPEIDANRIRDAVERLT